jgi:putative ABC transport system permease protein
MQILQMGIKLVQGRDFSSGSVADSFAMLLNVAAVKTMGLKNPIGMQMKRFDKTYTVIGITENVVMSSPFKPVDPMMILYRPENSSFINVRLNKGIKPQEGLNALQAIFKKFNPAYPFEYQFADQEFGKKFANEELIGKLTNIFAGLAIFICCIGLAGLASFTIEKRIREIGIRKVLGANTRQLLILISKDFLLLVFIAFVIAVPLTWWLMTDWLKKYTFHINISPWLFIGVGIVILLLTLLVVSLNTIRAALANPVKNLRTE